VMMVIVMGIFYVMLILPQQRQRKKLQAMLGARASHPSGPPALIASRVLAIPIIAGVGFESIRFMARHRRNPVIKVLLLPVLGTQLLTTREPSDDMMEVAICAFNSAREGEEATTGAAA